MKKSCYGKFHYLLLLMVLSFTVTNLTGQGFYNTTDWRFSNPKRFGFTVFDLDFFDNNRGISVGTSGGIAFTSDGGANWNYGPFNFINAAGLRTTADFQDVHFITSSTAYAVGGSGMMAKTTDGGQNWSFIQTPLFANSRNINAVWFIDANKGYIGGQWNTADSIPKLYFTNNGGATWDSLNAPVGGKTRLGYINNPNLAPLIWDVTAKGKEIYRIQFTSASNGYIIGSGQSHFPAIPAANGTTCLPNGGTATTSANNAALVWRFTDGILTDYSLSKERLGYTGINTNTITCTTQFNAAQIAPVVQTYRALGIINDSLIVIMSSNNNIVMRVHTGANDNTINMVTGLSERGRYQIMSFPFPPTQGPNAGSPIPNPNTLLASSPYHMKMAANGKLFSPVGSSVFNPENRLLTSIDTGRTWVVERDLPSGRNYSGYRNYGIDILPSGKFIAAGNAGVVSDSLPGGAWNSSYVTMPPAVNGFDTEFADCNSGMVVGGSSIAVTTDGGNTWVDRTRADFSALNININGLSYPTPSKAYFATSVGALYRTLDGGASMDPIYGSNSYQLNDVATSGNDTVWVTAYSAFSVAAASRTTTILRSIDNGVTFQAIGGFPVGTTSPNLSRISFANNLVGYIAGTRGAVYKTVNGGTTWSDVSPFPSLNNAPVGFPNSSVTYQEIQALDANTVIVIGNMFTNTGVRRVYKTTDGGTSWTDITGNIPALRPVGNIVGLAFHDANNGYVTAGNSLFITNDGGATWRIDYAPIGQIFESIAFSTKTVPAGIAMANRKLFLSGILGGASIMEYGNPANVNVNAAETVVNANCTNLTAGGITVNATGGIAPYTYSINGGAFQTSNVFTGLTQGPKTITIKDAYCGVLTKTVTVGFTDNLVLATNNDTTVCANAPVQMLASTNGTGATYAWSPSSGLSAANISNPIASVSANSAFTVTATLNGCVKSKTVNIAIKPNPVVDAGADKQIVEGDQTMLAGSAANVISVAWTPSATLSFANTLNPVAKPNATTVYTLTVRNSDGCTSTDNVTVNVIPYCAKVMNAFTPNRDGSNDLWLVTNGAPCTNRIRAAVYNRYGQEVYKSENYQNNWDGTYNGKPVPDGTYYYAVTYYFIGGRQVTLKGDVTILR